VGFDRKSRLKDCSFEVPPFLGELPFLEPDGSISGSSGRRPHGSFDLPGDGVDLRVVGRGSTVGRFVLVPAGDQTVSPERLIVAVALADELGLAFAATAS